MWNDTRYMIDIQTKLISDDIQFTGKNAIIGAGTVIFSNVSIGNNTIIGPLNVLESGVWIGDNVTIQPHGVFARDTMIQNNVFIGPHFTCANDKFIQDGEHGLSKNKKPFKQENIIIKEGTRIGTHCVVAPGVTIGKNCFIKMNCFIKKDVPDNTTIMAGTIWQDDYEF